MTRFAPTPAFLACLALLMALSISCGDETDSGPAVPQDGAPADKSDAAEATHTGKADWSFDICERRGWYDDGACDWFCSDPDPDCAIPAFGDEPAGVGAAYPIILAHGFQGSRTNIWSFYQVEEALKADGHVVYAAEVPPYDAVDVRSGHLAGQIDAVLEATGAEKVNLIAHSMGGLDSRYAISSLGYDDRVASLTTIASPHQGTAVADFALGLIPGAADGFINAVAYLMGITFSDVAEDPHLRDALASIAEENAARFNADNPDVDGVYYQSWAGVSTIFGSEKDRHIEACENKFVRHAKGGADKVDFRLVLSAPVAGHWSDNLPNDGMATVEGAKLGKFRGCLPADHLDQIGQPEDDGQNEHTGFDHIRFYRTVAFELAELGY